MLEEMIRLKSNIEDIKNTMRILNEKLQLIVKSHDKNKKIAAPFLEKTFDDVREAEKAIAGLDPDTILQKANEKPGKNTLRAMEAVMILLQKPKDW